VALFFARPPDASGPYYPPIAEIARSTGLVRTRVRVARAKKSAMPAMGIARKPAWSADE